MRDGTQVGAWEKNVSTGTPDPGPSRPEGAVELGGPSAKNLGLVGLALWAARREMGAAKRERRGFAQSWG